MTRFEAFKRAFENLYSKKGGEIVNGIKDYILNDSEFQKLLGDKLSTLAETLGMDVAISIIVNGNNSEYILNAKYLDISWVALQVNYKTILINVDALWDTAKMYLQNEE